MSDPGSPDSLRLSVVIPTFNDQHCLELTVRALTRQTLPAERFEVVVVNDGGDMDFRGVERFRDDLQLQVVHMPGGTRQDQPPATSHYRRRDQLEHRPAPT